MNRYPWWKNLLIGLTVVIGLLYTLPNFYGESPAVQVGSSRAGAPVDAALMQRVEAALNRARLPYGAAYLDPEGIKVRFASTDAQIQARDVLQQALGADYTVALNLLSNSPHWLSRIGALPMYLGLDLRGGVHFLLQVDTQAAVDKTLDRFVGDVRRLLREEKVYHRGIRRAGPRLEVRFKEPAQRARAVTLMEKNFPELAFTEQDAAGEYRLSASLTPQAVRQIQEYAVKQNLTTLRNRVNELGVAEPIIQQQGAERVVVQLPGVQDTAKAKEILGRTATLEVRMVDEEADVAAAQQGRPAYGTEFYVTRDGQPVVVKKDVVLTGEAITDAAPGFDQQSGQAAVHINLDAGGARVFKDVSRANVGKRMAILLVERGRAEVITAPVIREEIGGGRVQITGMESAREASDVALLLRAGALAAPMEIIEERTVGPSLGAENIERGFDSTLYGFLAIAAFMIFYYTVFGVISVLSLAANLLFLVALLSMLQATLTLPGMAGIALTLGMAIDANVLINERIREEIRNGMTPQAAINAGYERAFGTILDSNITTLIAGIALFLFGSGPIKGFAVVLCLGILTSMFSAIMVSRALTNLIYGRRKRVAKLAIG